MIDKIGQTHNRTPICLITRMITDLIGRHEVQLPIINHNCKILQNVGFLKLKTQEIPRIFLLAVKKSHLSAHT